MSIEYSEAVWALPKLTSVAARIVLLAIANHANAQGLAYPGNRLLAQRATLSERQVQRIIAQLVEAGLIEVIGQGNGRGHTRLIRLCFPPADLHKRVISQNGARPPAGVQKGDILPSKGDTAMSPFFDLKDDTAMSPFSDLPDQKGDTAMSPFSDQKGDTAMSPFDDQKGDILARKGDILARKGDMPPVQTRLTLTTTNTDRSLVGGDPRACETIRTAPAPVETFSGSDEEPEQPPQNSAGAPTAPQQTPSQQQQNGQRPAPALFDAHKLTRGQVQPGAGQTPCEVLFEFVPYRPEQIPPVWLVEVDQTVSDLARWRAVLKECAGRGWRPYNLADRLEVYQKGFRQNDPARPLSTDTRADHGPADRTNSDSRLRHIQRGLGDSPAWSWQQCVDFWEGANNVPDM